MIDLTKLFAGGLVASRKSSDFLRLFGWLVAHAHLMCMMPWDAPGMLLLNTLNTGIPVGHATGIHGYPGSRVWQVGVCVLYGNIDM